MLHLVHLRHHYFVHSVITTVSEELGCSVLKKQLHCPGFVRLCTHTRGDPPPLSLNMEGITAAALGLVLEVEALSWAAKFTAPDWNSLQFLRTSKSWFPVCVCTSRCDWLTTVQILLYSKSIVFLVAYL